MRASRIVLSIAVAALVGSSIFGRLVYQAVDMEQVTQSEALTRFKAVHERFVNQATMLEVDASGRVAPAASPPEGRAGSREVRRLEVLAYHVADERLVMAHVPFWFFTLKRPAVQFAVRGTGLDLDELQLTAENLARHGPGLILDRIFPNGDRLLVWAE